MEIIKTLFVLLMVSMGSIVVAAYTTYSPSWQYIVDMGGYETLYSWSVEGDFYDEKIYLTVVLNNTSNGNRDFGVSAYYLNGSSAWNFTLDVSGYDYVRGCFPDPTSDYLLVVGYIYNVFASQWDGVVVRVNRSDPSDWYGVYFDTGQSDFLESVYVDGAGTIYVVGLIYNSTDKKYEGVIGKFDNYSLASYTWRVISLSGYNMTLYDVTVGTDGYVYVTGHVLYYYRDTNTGDVYYIPLYQLVYKMDPENLDLINSTYIPLYTSQGYVNIINTMKVDITGCGDGVCVAGLYYDEATGDPTSPTLGAFVEKLDGSFNKLWRRNISTTYSELFHGISSDVSGNIVVTGRTSNDYGTGLNTDYYHVLITVFDANGNLREAFLAGGDLGDIAFDAAIDFNGGVYVSGVQYSTTLDFYNITNDITVSAKPAVEVSVSVGGRTVPVPTLKIVVPKPESLSLLASTLQSVNSGDLVVSDDTGTAITPPILISREPLIPPLKPLQAGDDDKALLVSLGYYVDPQAVPPTPIPEPIVVPIVLVMILTVVYYYSRRR